MQRKFILKFDVKEGNLRCHFYKAESIRLNGECKVEIPEDNKLSKGYCKVLLDNLFIQLNDEFHIGFEKNSIANIRNWIKQNIFKIYIRENVPSLLENAIFKSVQDGTIVIKD
jgi:hypothetical protein